MSELKGEEIIPREKGKGIFFDKEVINSYDFLHFTEYKSIIMHRTCKRNFVRINAFNNIIFLEMGDII